LPWVLHRDEQLGLTVFTELLSSEKLERGKKALAQLINYLVSMAKKEMATLLVNCYE
jgi:hypothetical protein